MACTDSAGWPLRGAEGDCVAAWLEQGSHPQPHSARKTKGPIKGPLIFLAEKAGFEPAVRYKRTLAFQASALNHSATSPDSVCLSVSYPI